MCGTRSHCPLKVKLLEHRDHVCSISVPSAADRGPGILWLRVGWRDVDGEQEGKASSPVHTGTEWGQHLEDAVSHEAGQCGDSTQGRSRPVQGWTLTTATDIESP